MLLRKIGLFLPVVIATLFCLLSSTQESKPLISSNEAILMGARVFVAPMEGGFETYLTAALIKKQVPVVVVTDKSKADYEISGVSESEKAGWAKIIFMDSEASREQASIKVMDLRTGNIVFAYAVHKGRSYRGKQSAAEACAKHFKQRILQK